MIQKAWDEFGKWLGIYIGLHLLTFILRRLIMKFKKNGKPTPPSK